VCLYTTQLRGRAREYLWFIRDLLGWASYSLVIANAVTTPGQGELRGKVHLSHRCVAVAAGKDLRPRRRHPYCQATNQTPICCESCSFVEELTLSHAAFLAYHPSKSRMNHIGTCRGGSAKPQIHRLHDATDTNWDKSPAFGMQVLCVRSVCLWQGMRETLICTADPEVT
jgi:hypothetical protein